MKYLQWPDWNREQDPGLYDHYERNIIEPGWAGKLEGSEVDYLSDVLEGSITNPYAPRLGILRRQWGFRGDQCFFNPDAIRLVAREGNPDDAEHNRKLVESVSDAVPVA